MKNENMRLNKLHKSHKQEIEIQNPEKPKTYKRRK